MRLHDVVLMLKHLWMECSVNRAFWFAHPLSLRLETYASLSYFLHQFLLVADVVVVGYDKQVLMFYGRPATRWCSMEDGSPMRLPSNLLLWLSLSGIQWVHLLVL